jgi:molecular chaperone GrpE
MRSSDEERQGPVIRDRRRIDPQTGQVRDQGRPGSQDRGRDRGVTPPGQPQRGPGQPRPGKHSASTPGGTQADQGARGGGLSFGAASAGQQEPADGETGQDNGTASETAVKLAERTADLQRLQAEYANYRKRVERDRIAVREQALANVLQQLLPVLDDIGRAREHGELTGGFKSVAESLEQVAAKLGLTAFGETGDPFDPNLHEALMHSYSADVTEPTCVQILQPGYKVGDRIVRPARVAVAEPGDEPDTPQEHDTAAAADDGEPGAEDDAEPGGTDEGDQEPRAE